MTQGPIVSNGRGERGGGWNIDRWAAMLALTISVASAVVAMLEGRAMERLVTANSWPFLEYETGNFDDERRLPLITLEIANNGVGPARLESLRVSVGDRPVHGWRELLETCCSQPEEAEHSRAEATAIRFGTIMSSPVTPRVIPAKQRIVFISWLRPDGASPEWQALDQARFKLRLEACYCSVFDDCWVSDLRGSRPQPVKQCESNQEHAYR